MARPPKNNVEYFPFICEEGKKMYYIEETYGNDGFATFVKILRELAKADYHYLNLSSPSTVMFLSAKCKVQKEVLLSIVNDLVELGKFDKLLWSENNIIWCQDFVDSVEDAYKKRNNKCITYEGLLLLLISLGVRKPSKLPSKVHGNPQSKVEESKVEEIRVDETKTETYSPHFLNPEIADQVTQLTVAQCRERYDKECQAQKESIGMNLRIKLDQLKPLQDSFDAKLKSKSTTKTFQDYTNHFANWVNKLPVDELKRIITPERELILPHMRKFDPSKYEKKC